MPLSTGKYTTRDLHYDYGLFHVLTLANDLDMYKKRKKNFLFVMLEITQKPPSLGSIRKFDIF